VTRQVASPSTDGGATGHGPLERRWLVAAAMGLITSSFSTLFVLLVGDRIGRDVALSWMEVGLVVLRDSGAVAEPGVREVVVGIAVHQAADFSWAFLFFGVLAPFTWRFHPAQLLAIAPLWALTTAAVEYWLILPWLQPLLIMQTPFWIAAAVHLSSAA